MGNTMNNSTIYNEENENLPDLMAIYNEVEPTHVPDTWVEDFKAKYVPEGQSYIGSRIRGYETTLSVCDVITAFKTLVHQDWLKESVEQAIANESFHPEGEPLLDGGAIYKLHLFCEWWPLWHGRDILDDEGFIHKKDPHYLGTLIKVPAIFFHQGMPLEEVLENHIKPFLPKPALPIKHGEET